MPRPSTHSLALTFSLATLAVAPAAAQDYGSGAYAPAGRYGYAEGFVRGDYVGAPFTRVPRPTRLVPTPWSYGTYGVPTISGIAAAPAAPSRLTVVNGRGAPAPQAGMQVIEVRVPRR